MVIMVIFLFFGTFNSLLMSLPLLQDVCTVTCLCYGLRVWLQTNKLNRSEILQRSEISLDTSTAAAHDFRGYFSVRVFFWIRFIYYRRRLPPEQKR